MRFSAMGKIMHKILLKQALGFGQDQHYDARIGNGFEWCLRWLIKNKAYHGLDLDNAMICTLKDLVK